MTLSSMQQVPTGGRYLWVAAMLATSFALANGEAPTIEDSTYCSFLLNTRVRQVHPPRHVPIIADLLFIHGFADSIGSRSEAFVKYANHGYRIVGFDFPSHGLSSGRGIGTYTTRTLGKLAGRVLGESLEDPGRPLVVMAYSYGGELALSMLKRGQFGRRPVAMVLLAPAVAVPLLPGKFGIVTAETVSSDPRAREKYQPKPISAVLTPVFSRTPPISPVFAMSLLWNSWQLQSQALPPDLPIKIILAGEETDLYVNSKAIRAWAEHQRTVSGAQIWTDYFPRARHMIDTEPFGVGERVQDIALDFLDSFMVPDKKSSMVTTPGEIVHTMPFSVD